jgi:hypoxanthine phosphoribosyltransferase
MNEDDSRLLRIPGQIAGVKSAYHIAYHHAMRAGFQERISKYLPDFKEGKEPQTSRWIALATPLICEGRYFDIVVRALRSDEMIVDGASPLDRWGDAIARERGVVYCPERLRKMRATKPLHELGGRTARQAELADVYKFDASGLEPTAKVLVIDDLFTTGSTVAAIAAAVHKALPTSEIVCCVLYKSDALCQNIHLDPAYFGVEDLPSQATAKASQKTASTISNVQSSPKPPVRQNSVPKQRENVKKSPVKYYVGTLVFAFLVFGAFVPLKSGKQPLPAGEALAASFPVAEEAAKVVPPPPPVPGVELPPGSKQLDLRQGIITVPNAGLRVNHAMGSATVPRVAVKSGERVGVVRKFSTAAGPGWVQIRTRAGKVGWVFASVVKEK